MTHASRRWRRIAISLWLAWSLAGAAAAQSVQAPHCGASTPAPELARVDEIAPGDVQSLLAAGEQHRAAGRYAQAEQAFRRALDEAGAGQETTQRLAALGGLASTLVASGATRAAHKLLDEALELSRSNGETALTAAIHNERGNLLAREGRNAEAQSAYQQAERIARAQGESQLAVRAAANAARAGVAAGEADQASLDALEAEIAALPDAETKAQLWMHLGRTAQMQAASTGEREAVLRSARAYSAAIEAAGRINDLRALSYAQGYLAEVYESDERLDDALVLSERALIAAEAADSPDARYRWQWQRGRILNAQGHREPALLAYRSAVESLSGLRRAVDPRLGRGAASFAESVGPLYSEFVDLLLQQAAHKGSENGSGAMLAEARETLEDLKYAELQDYFQDACVQEQRALGELPGVLVVYPVALPDRLELIVEQGGQLRRYSSPVGQEQLDARARDLRRALERRTTRDYRRPAADLYDWLIRPIEAQLSQDTIDALVFVPGGALRTIPMGALRDRNTGDFLIERFPVAVTPSLKLTEPRPIDREQIQMLAAGLTEAVQGFPPLENVAEEIHAAGAAFTDNETLMDAAFTRGALRDQLGQRQFGIVHLASHGEFLRDVSESYLLAYDGPMTMDQMAGMVERTRQREQPLELLTLSACKTAAGDERAALGLAGVAVRAGARSAIATLWSVNDQAAADLVSEFYQRLSEPGATRARALQQAQLALIREHALRHPFYWSPFLLINNWL